jgi:hypothetical protein
MEKHLATCQEACRKDIERVFGVLVKQFQILQRPIISWYWQDIVLNIMDTCIIMHNMIVESRRELFSVWYAATDTFCATNNNNQQPPNVSLFRTEEENTTGNILVGADLLTRLAIRVAHLNESIKNQQEHFSLKNDLMSHLWERKQNQARQTTDDYDDDDINNNGDE